jgi:hypothetical protein
MIGCDVDALEQADGEGTSLAGSALGLGNHVPTRGHWCDCARLDGAGFLETVAVDATEELVLEAQRIEVLVRSDLLGFLGVDILLEDIAVVVDIVVGCCC